jgi:hypothetical protein
MEKQDGWSQKMLLVFNENPLGAKHVSWNVKRSGSDLVLEEVVISYYRHPQALEEAVVPVYEVHSRFKCREDSFEAAPLHLLLQTQNNMSLLHKSVDTYDTLRHVPK